jgi:hypothetical protein
MEPYIDGCLSQLIDALDRYAAKGEIVDLKCWIRLYIFDVLGELAFSQSFGALKTGDESVIPPVTEHVRLATVAGQIPEHTTQLIKLMSYAPIPWIKGLYRGRAALREVQVFRWVLIIVDSTVCIKTFSTKGLKTDRSSRPFDRSERSTDREDVGCH